MPHLVAPRAFNVVFESTVFQAEDASSRAAAKVHIDQSIGDAIGGDCLPDVANLV